MVRAILTPDLFAADSAIAGTFCYRGDPPQAILFVCPCGCKTRWRIALRPYGKDGQPSWDWNGNRDRPTLSPSLHLLEGDPDAPENETASRREDFKMRTHWHGWLRNGEFVSC